MTQALDTTPRRQPACSLAGQWFLATEATGDFMGIRYGRKAADSGSVEWRFVSHCECDGIGGFARLLREDGAVLPQLPQTKHPSRGVLAPLWHHFRSQPMDDNQATRADWAPGDAAESAVPEAVAWHLFSEAETERIRQHCRREAISVNSFLLKQLDQAIRPDIRTPDATIPWMIPVNVRGDVRHADDTENHVSYVEAAIAVDDSAADIQQQISKRLARGEHRANYLVLGIGKFLSPQAKINLIRKTRSQPNGNIAAFSNLGVWDSEKQLPTTDAWFFCPPIAKGQLLGAGCVTFQNQLSLTLQAHPAFNDRPEVAQAWMARWVSAL